MRPNIEHTRLRLLALIIKPSVENLLFVDSLLSNDKMKKIFVWKFVIFVVKSKWTTIKRVTLKIVIGSFFFFVPFNVFERINIGSSSAIVGPPEEGDGGPALSAAAATRLPRRLSLHVARDVPKPFHAQTMRKEFMKFLQKRDYNAFAR